MQISCWILFCHVLKLDFNILTFLTKSDKRKLWKPMDVSEHNTYIIDLEFHNYHEVSSWTRFLTRRYQKTDECFNQTYKRQLLPSLISYLLKWKHILQESLKIDWIWGSYASVIADSFPCNQYLYFNMIPILVSVKKTRFSAIFNWNTFLFCYCVFVEIFLSEVCLAINTA